jgi:hypothetical protein
MTRPKAPGVKAKPKTEPKPVTSLTSTQTKVLNMIGRAYAEDVPVNVGVQSRWRGTSASSNRTVTRALIDADLVRYSRPRGEYVLLTVRGKAVLGIVSEAEAARTRLDAQRGVVRSPVKPG